MADDCTALRRVPRLGPADLAETPETAAPVASGATNPGDPVSVDHEDVSSRFSSRDRDELDQALWRGRTLRGLAEAASPETRRELVDTILAAGWRPLPDALSPWDAYREAYNDFRRDVPSWKAHFTAHHMHALEAALRVYDPPAPQVYFPGDTVPRGAAAVNEDGDLVAGAHRVMAIDGPVVELRTPSPEEWQAAVDRARAEREAGRG